MSHQVLVIDDDPMLLELLQMQLEREGFSVITATDSQQAVQQLHALRPQPVTVMLTGDNARVARTIAAEVGIDDVRAGLLPEQKLAAIRELEQQYETVAMVGDGINDAPALAAASIGIAMGHNRAAQAMETADIVLMQNDLSRLVAAVQLSRRTLRIIRQNVALSLGIKAVFLLLRP